MCSLNPGRAPSYGSCFWESPWAIQGILAGMGTEGTPGPPSPFLPSSASFPGQSAAGAGAGWGQCPTLAPCPGCVAAADVPPVPGALRGAGRMQALLCISN